MKAPDGRVDPGGKTFNAILSQTKPTAATTRELLFGPAPANTGLLTRVNPQRFRKLVIKQAGLGLTLTKGEDLNDGKNGGIFIYPIGDNQYIADIWCYTTMRQSEHLYYKVTEHNDTIESRLLILKQFFHTQYGGNTSIQEMKNPKGEFVQFTDALAYGQTLFYPERPILPRLLIKKEFIGAGTCGLYTVYDISGDCPKVIEFRANLSCTPDAPSVDNWHLYPVAQTARWRIIPNPQRKDWKTPATPACSK